MKSSLYAALFGFCLLYNASTLAQAVTKKPELTAAQKNKVAQRDQLWKEVC